MQGIARFRLDSQMKYCKVQTVWRTVTRGSVAVLCTDMLREKVQQHCFSLIVHRGTDPLVTVRHTVFSRSISVHRTAKSPSCSAALLRPRCQALVCLHLHINLSVYLSGIMLLVHDILSIYRMSEGLLRLS